MNGEDWAEWLVHYLATLLEMPTASILPAQWGGRRGILSRSVLHHGGERLDHGNSVLSARFADYDQSRTGENPGYTVAAVKEALEGVGPPVEVKWPSSFTAYDVWAGYLLLDAWVAGRDRHHENWAVILSGEDRRLAPSFDHGNALAFQERDARQAWILNDEERFSRWLNRGTSRHFRGKPHLVDLALQALSLASPVARSHWFEKLSTCSEDSVQALLYEVPDDIMSETSRIFAVRLLEETRRRLLNGHENP